MKLWVKLKLLISGVILLGVGLVTLFESARARDFLRADFDRQSESVAQILTPIFLEPLLRGHVPNPDHYRTVLARVLASNEDLLEIRVLDDLGAPLLPELPGETRIVHPRALQIIQPITIESSGLRRPIGWMEIQFDTGRLDRVIRARIEESVRNALVLLALGAVASYLIARSVTRSIEALSRGMVRVREGDLDARVAVASRDEVGDLARAFNEMVEGLRAKKELLHYVSRSAWEAAHRRATGDEETAGTARVVTILFADIKDFTPMTARTPAPQVVALLNRYFDAIVREVLRQNGTVDKFIGDALMAFFEGPDGGAAAALAAARAMQATLADLRAKGEIPFHARVGLNTGEVILGDIGSIESRRDFTCIGDPVNVASRLCYTGETDGIHLGNETWRRIENPPEAEKRTGLRVKGIERPLDTYLVR